MFSLLEKIQNLLKSSSVDLLEGLDPSEAANFSATEQREKFLSGGNSSRELLAGPQSPVPVKVEGSHLGQRIDTPQGAFELKNIFSGESNLLGNDKFSRVYFRTDSGNIYMLNSDGKLVNGNESRRQGKAAGYQLNTEQLQDARIAVGESFRFGSSGRTTAITEIVPVTDQVYSEESLSQMTRGEVSSIAEDLRNLIQPSVEQTTPQEKERKVKSFRTAQGSIYTYDADGKTTRFKTATGEQHERQDVTVFVNLSPQEEQDYLSAYLGEEGKRDGFKIYVIERQRDGTAKKVRDIRDIADKNEVYLTIVDTKTNTYRQAKKASITPQIGYNTYDTRKFQNEKGEWMTERHLGNKVVDIQYEN